MSMLICLGARLMWHSPIVRYEYFTPGLFTDTDANIEDKTLQFSHRPRLRTVVTRLWQLLTHVWQAYQNQRLFHVIAVSSKRCCSSQNEPRITSLTSAPRYLHCFRFMSFVVCFSAVLRLYWLCNRLPCREHTKKTLVLVF